MENKSWESVDDELKKLLSDTKLDEADGRRKVREAFKHFLPSIDHFLFKAQYHGLRMKEMYEINSRGVEIFSKSWVPENSPIKALVCFCHGYGDTCTFFVEGIAKKLASCGYGVFAMDYPGFGLSEGLHGYIPSFDCIVDDVIEHFTKIKEQVEYSGLPSFMFGQSMGGAVALKVHFKQPNAWDGAILLAPMCKIADEMVPPWILQQILIGVANFLPRAQLCPEKDLGEMALRIQKKRMQTFFNVIAYKHKPRLRTAVELLNTTQEIGHRLTEVSLPLLVLHGESDVVTDPSVSKHLYEQACSTDKKLNLYKDAYHCLLEGEPDEISFQVFDDIVSWLNQHQTKISTNESWKQIEEAKMVRCRTNTQKLRKGHNSIRLSQSTYVYFFTSIAIISLVPYIFFQLNLK